MGRLLHLAKQMAWSLPIGIAFTDLVASVVKVEGPSMQPTFNPDINRNSDWVAVEKVSYKLLHKYRRGDVAVLWAPDDPHMQITKRLVALEKDVIWDDDQNGPEVIPQGRCWIEGDNTDRSSDSRNMYGPVHLGLLEGRALCIIWPPSRIGSVQCLPLKGRIISQASTQDAIV